MEKKQNSYKSLQKKVGGGGRGERERKTVLNPLALTAEKQLSFSSFFSYIGDL